MAEVLLITPRQDFRKETYRRMEVYPPLGLLYIATQLKKENIDVKILDTCIEPISLHSVIADRPSPGFSPWSIHEYSMR
jgi:hypothetical protein